MHSQIHTAYGDTICNKYKCRNDINNAPTKILYQTQTVGTLLPPAQWQRSNVAFPVVTVAAFVNAVNFWTV